MKKLTNSNVIILRGVDQNVLLTYFSDYVILSGIIEEENTITFSVKCSVINHYNELGLDYRLLIIKDILYSNKLFNYYFRLAIIVLSMSNFKVVDIRPQSNTVCELWKSDDSFRFRESSVFFTGKWIDIKDDSDLDLSARYRSNEFCCLRVEKYNFCRYLYSSTWDN